MKLKIILQLFSKVIDWDIALSVDIKHQRWKANIISTKRLKVATLIARLSDSHLSCRAKCQVLTSYYPWIGSNAQLLGNRNARKTSARIAGNQLDRPRMWATGKYYMSSELSVSWWKRIKKAPGRKGLFQITHTHKKKKYRHKPGLLTERNLRLVKPMIKYFGKT